MGACTVRWCGGLPNGNRVLRLLRGFCSCSTACRHSSSGTTSGSCWCRDCPHWNSFTRVVIVEKRKSAHHVHAIARVESVVVTQHAWLIGQWLMCVTLASVKAQGPMSERESPRLLSRLRSPPSRCCRRTCQQGAGELNRNLQPCHWQHVASVLEQQSSHDLPQVTWDQVFHSLVKIVLHFTSWNCIHWLKPTITCPKKTADFISWKLFYLYL